LDTNQLLNSFLFQPERGFYITPDRLGLAYEDMVFQAQDGTGLHGWFIPGRGPAAILFMHGVAGNISHRAENAAALHANLGTHVFLFDYRGYGRSSGEPSEEGTYLDAEAAFETLRKRPDVDPERIILFGHSLGGAVAIELAVRLGKRICGLIVESSFTTGREIAKFLFPVAPRNAIPEFYNSLDKIGRVEAPVLVTHAEQDSLLPLEMGQALYAAAREPKYFYLVPGADHPNIYQIGGRAYFEQLATFINRCTRV